MALGKRRQKQTSFWVETSQLQVRGRHPFYSRLNEILDRAKFDTYAERICRKYYATTMGRPSTVRRKTTMESCPTRNSRP